MGRDNFYKISIDPGIHQMLILRNRGDRYQDFLRVKEKEEPAPGSLRTVMVWL